VIGQECTLSKPYSIVFLGEYYDVNKYFFQTNHHKGFITNKYYGNIQLISMD